MWSSIIRKCSKIMFLCQNAINSYHWHYIIIINRSLFCVGHFCPSFFLRFQGTQLKSRSFKQYRNSSSFLILYLCLPNCCRCRRLLLHPITLKDTHTVRRSPLDECSARRAVTSTWQPTTLAGNRHWYTRRDVNPQSQQAKDRRPTPLERVATGIGYIIITRLNTFLALFKWGCFRCLNV